MKRRAMEMAVVAAIVAGLTGAWVYAGCGTCGAAAKKAACAPQACPVGKACDTDKKAACGPEGCPVGKACKMEKCPVAHGGEAVINTEGLEALIRAKAPVTILDARSGKYDDGRRIPGAKALSPTAEEAEVTKALPDKGALIVTYCAGLTCPASKALSDKLKKLGYTNVIEYPEGIEGWAKNGRTVEQAK